MPQDIKPIADLSLSAGELECAISPHVGGSIARFDRVTPEGRQALMRPAPAGSQDVLAMASFPIVPYANRIRDGRFLCDGRLIELAPNLPGDPSPLHGQGWLAAWDVASSDVASATLTFRHEPGEWPWRYEAWQDLTLDAGGLTVTLGCRNLSAERMPCGLALHPYFPCDAGTVIDVDVAGAWTIDAQTLPVERVAATGRFDLRNRAICGTGFDNGFDGWSGAAKIRWSDRPASLVMSSSDAACFQTYSPPGDFFVAEPVQNVNAALNRPQEDWAALGIVLLQQGEERLLRTRFDVQV